MRVKNKFQNWCFILLFLAFLGIESMAHEWMAPSQEAGEKNPFEIDKDSIDRGRAVYLDSCAVCHGATGAGIPPAFPAMTGSAVATGPIETHLDIILNGKNIMPAWKDVLNDTDIAAVIAYERNALGNSTGDIIQPKAVKAAR